MPSRPVCSVWNLWHVGAWLCLWLAPGAVASADHPALAGEFPRVDYEDVDDIDALAASLRAYLASQDRYSFSRGWWRWDRLRARYVDGGRQDRHALLILRAAFQGLILDWHQRLEARGEGDLFFIFFVTTAPGDKTKRDLKGRTLVRDLHGGGYHGGWGGAARMRIYDELVREGMLTAGEQARFRQIVFQSMSPKFLDFSKGSQTADNHSFGNGGGIAWALKLFPDAPGAPEARAWIDRIWSAFAEFGDWKEWTYYPYGPIFLHGLLDIAEATGRIETDRALIESVAGRVLANMHGSGVRGNPNSGARVRADLTARYDDLWNGGYYQVETNARDGHFWYRLAQHTRRGEHLWAAEQVLLGGRGPGDKAPPEYVAAYRRRFAWFVQRGIVPRTPKLASDLGTLSPSKHRIPERLILAPDRQPGSPFAGFFLYEHKSAHLDNVAGHLYEFSAAGAKLLHSSGKYNNVYADNRLKGGGTGEESLNLLLGLHERHRFPLHPDRHGDARDPLRRGNIQLMRDHLVVQQNKRGDAFGQYAFRGYYGQQSVWTRRAVLTREGVLLVEDTYRLDPALGSQYRAGPVWHVAREEGGAQAPAEQDRPWFDAPAFDQAWWRDKPMRLLLRFHDDARLEFGSLTQTHSQDTDPNLTVHASRPVTAGRPEMFLTVLVPYEEGQDRQELLASIETRQRDGKSYARVGHITIEIDGGEWRVERR